MLCIAAGGVVGLLAALAVPRGAMGRRFESEIGLAVGLASVLMIRGTALLVGEAAGLLAGMVAGVAAASAARTWVFSRGAT